MKTLEPFNVIEDRMGRRYYLDSDVPHPESTADLYAEHKRFKTGELAAEVWFFVMADYKYPEEPDDLTDEEWEDLNRQRREAEAALERFATHDDAGRTDYQ